MSIKQTIANAVDRNGSTAQCAGCALTFDRDPPNCPACGSSEIRSS